MMPRTIVHPLPGANSTNAVCRDVTAIMALNLAPFGRWTLRENAAQRRSALRWGS
jgi:hypothetical protein